MPPAVVTAACGVVHLSILVLPFVVPLAAWLLASRTSARLRRHAAAAFDVQATFAVVLAAAAWGLRLAQAGGGGGPAVEGVLTPVVLLLLIAGVVLPLVGAVQGFTGDQRPWRFGIPLISRRA